MNRTNPVARKARVALSAADLFVVLEKAFRRRARECEACAFSIPFFISASGTRGANWTVVPGAQCTENCRLVLEEIIAKHQSSYRLADPPRL